MAENGVHLETPVTRAEARSRLGLNGSELVVGSVAALRPEKGARAPPGGGRAPARRQPPGSALPRRLRSAREELRRLASRLGIEAGDVVWAGQRARRPRLVTAFDVAVISSRWEGLPLAALEALAAECRWWPRRSAGSPSSSPAGPASSWFPTAPRSRRAIDRRGARQSRRGAGAGAEGACAWRSATGSTRRSGGWRRPTTRPSATGSRLMRIVFAGYHGSVHTRRWAELLRAARRRRARGHLRRPRGGERRRVRGPRPRPAAPGQARLPREDPFARRLITSLRPDVVRALRDQLRAARTGLRRASARGCPHTATTS